MVQQKEGFQLIKLCSVNKMSLIKCKTEEVPNHKGIWVGPEATKSIMTMP